MKNSGRPKYKKSLIPFLVTAVSLSLAYASVDVQAGEPPQEHLQKPLFGRVESKETEAVDIENMDQCAGTMRHYRFPPSDFEPRKQDSKSRRGKALYDKLNCVECHAIEGRGGELGPPLDGIGGHRGRQWLVARLLDPETQMRDFPDVFESRKNVMPHPGISKKDATLISYYLLTLPEPDSGWLITTHTVKSVGQTDNPGFKPRPEDQASKRGAKLFLQLYCASCHTTDGEGNRAGPDLRGIGSRRSETELHDILTGSVKSLSMRAITKSIDKDELEDLKAFLLTLPN